MKNFATIVIVSIVLSCVIVTGCKKESPTDEGFEYSEATITHAAFDFSAGISDTVNWEKNDGETIIWQPGGETHPDYPRNDQYIWWRNSNIDTVDHKNQTKDMGEVDISSVSTVPATWDTTPLIPPLLTGHLIVAKCKDGYVKFKVLSADSGGNWSANVEYYFSTSSAFAH